MTRKDKADNSNNARGADEEDKVMNRMQRALRREGLLVVAAILLDDRFIDEDDTLEGFHLAHVIDWASCEPVSHTSRRIHVNANFGNFL